MECNCITLLYLYSQRLQVLLFPSQHISQGYPRDLCWIAILIGSHRDNSGWKGPQEVTQSLIQSSVFLPLIRTRVTLQAEISIP